LSSGNKLYVLLPDYKNKKKVRAYDFKKIEKIKGVNGHTVRHVLTNNLVIRGCSGGPLLTYDGKVVGVVSGLIEIFNISLSVPPDIIIKFTSKTNRDY